MSSSRLSTVLGTTWILHICCAATALLACIPILWPEESYPDFLAPVLPQLGQIIAGSVLASVVTLLITCTHFLLRIKNLQAFLQLIYCSAIWGIGVLIFVEMAIEADVPSPYETAERQPIQETATLHQPTENITSPASLVIPIDPETSQASTIAAVPNLEKLEKEHEELLTAYITRSPRWAYADKGDTFYTRPGHVVLVPPSSGGIPGTVHATFRTVAEGEQLPDGFVPVKPGDAFPQPTAENEELPDIALMLSGKHHLLLAWRGTKHRDTAQKAINAAITTIDSQVQKLAENPTEETLERMCTGKRKRRGSTPELRVVEPNNQYGIYQAEVYANTGRPGTLLLAIRDINDDNKLLRLFSFPARYSPYSQEIFRHDIPGSQEEWIRDSTVSDIAHLFPPGAPFFAIKCGESHNYFGVSFELQFAPSGSDATEPQTLLRRHYKVQAYENQPAE